MDIAPTVLSAARTGIAGHELDGIALKTAMRSATAREMVFAQLAFPQGSSPDERAACSTYMAVTERWKYFYSAPDDREFLFDRIQDPLETRNRAGGPFCQDALTAMRSALIRHLKEGGGLRDSKATCGSVSRGRRFRPTRTVCFSSRIPPGANFTIPHSDTP